MRDRLAAAGLRVELDERQEKIGYKIREAQLQKVPYMLVVGDREAEQGAVSVRSRTGGDQGARPVDEFIAAALDEVARKGTVGLARGNASAFAASGQVPIYEEVQLSLSIAPVHVVTTARRINERIRVREIRVIDDAGQQLGIMSPQQALAIARQKGLDLVEVAPMAQPPVCRIMDFGKYQYQEQKRAREARKHQKVIEVKEIKFRPKVDEHDYQFKKKHIERFLADGDKVKATIFFRGREMAHPEIGRRILERLIQELADVAVAEIDAEDGRQHDAHHPQRTSRAGSRGAEAGAQAPPPPGGGQQGSSEDDNEEETHAETQDAPGRREALQEDGDREVPAQQGVQAPPPDAARRPR